MKVILLIPRLGVGGAQRQILLLARGLDRLGHDVTVASLAPATPPTTDASVAEAAARGDGASGPPTGAVRLEQLGRSNSPSARTLSALLRLVERERPDVLHSYLPSANIAAALVKRVRPETQVVWGLRMTEGEPGPYHLLHRFVFWLERRLPWKPDLSIANAPSVRRAGIAAGLPAERVAVIPNGFDSHEFRRDPGERERTREAWGIDADECLIGTVGRLDPMKGHEVFLQAAVRLLADDPELRFVCVGPDFQNRRRELGQMAKQLGIAERISWVSATTRIRGAYNALDVLCHPSLFAEGFPNAVAEALLCETPCVASDVGHSRQILGEEGAVVPAGDPDALAAATLAALQSPERDVRSPEGKRGSGSGQSSPSAPWSNARRRH